MDELIIEVTPGLQKMLDLQLAEGRYVDAAEYVRDLVRRDMAAHADFPDNRNQQTEGL
jgi:antitoxin ParD1/3/4